MYCGEVIAGGFKIRANWADGEEQTTNDTIPPTTPGALVLISKTATTALLSWSPSYDYRGIATYQLYSGSLLWETTDTKITVLSLTPNTLYSFYVVAKDAAGNVSGASPTLTFATDAAPVEIPTAPAPTGLTVMGMSDTTVTLSWETTPGSYAVAAGSGIVAAADTSGYLSWMASSGVVEYHISGGPSLVVTSGSTVTITGLTPNTFYGFTIKGKYTDGKFSLVSDLVTVTTLDVGVSINYRLTGDSGPLNGGSTASGTTY
jgi:chitodextrinase